MKYLLTLLAIAIYCQSVSAYSTPHNSSEATQIEFLKSREAMLEASLVAPLEAIACTKPITNKIAADACARKATLLKAETLNSLKYIRDRIRQIEHGEPTAEKRAIVN